MPSPPRRSPALREALPPRTGLSVRPATRRRRSRERRSTPSTAACTGPGSTSTTGVRSSRGRDLFGLPDWAEALNDGAPVWRAGANQTTRLVTEAPLVFGGTRVEPGEYTLFIDLSDEGWTFIVSAWPAQRNYDFENTDALFGAFDYTDDRDVLRMPMELDTLPASFDQLSWQFVDMTPTGGRLALLWGNRMASVSFTVAR